jgi:hypothetical protein
MNRFRRDIFHIHSLSVDGPVSIEVANKSVYTITIRPNNVREIVTVEGADFVPKFSALRHGSEPGHFACAKSVSLQIIESYREASKDSVLQGHART